MDEGETEASLLAEYLLIFDGWLLGKGEPYFLVGGPCRLTMLEKMGHIHAYMGSTNRLCGLHTQTHIHTERGIYIWYGELG